MNQGLAHFSCCAKGRYPIHSRHDSLIHISQQPPYPMGRSALTRFAWARGHSEVSVSLMVVLLHTPRGGLMYGSRMYKAEYTPRHCLQHVPLCSSAVYVLRRVAHVHFPNVAARTLNFSFDTHSWTSTRLCWTRGPRLTLYAASCLCSWGYIGLRTRRDVATRP